MTDPEYLRKQVAFIETLVADPRRLARPQMLASDVREQRFVMHTLQMAAQAALDVASHVVSDDRLGEPETNRELFALLDQAGWINPDLARRMADMAGFRNLVVHGYAKVDMAVVGDIPAHRLGDLLEYADAIRAGVH